MSRCVILSACPVSPALAAALRETLRCGDSVLFKASNRMDLKKVIELTGIS